MLKLFLKIQILSTCLLFQYSAMSQNNPGFIEIALWSKGLPNSNGTEKEPANDQKGIFTPMIRVYLPAKEVATGRAVVACPGGGYGALAYNHEGYDFAPFFNKQGIALIVLKYRMPKGGFKEVPFSDATEAIRLVKEHATEWNINPNDIGIMGSSAGGHLASTIATHSPKETRPNFQILLYPVITMDTLFTHRGSRNNLLGKNPSQELVDLYSNEKQVTKETPRAFIVYSDDDKVVPPENGIKYYLAMNKIGVPAVIHIYPTGGHGWGVYSKFKYHQQFLMELEAWLKSF